MSGDATWRQVARRIVTAIVMIAVVAWVLFPLYWAAISSVKPGDKLYGNALLPFVQFEPTLAHWRYVLSITKVTDALRNSAVIGFGGATIALMLGVPAAWAIARSSGRGPSEAVAWWLLVVRALPPVVFGPPIYLFARQFGMLDSVGAQTIMAATFGLVFVVVILDAIIRGVPVDLEHAAQLDGATPLQSLLRITLPLIAPGLVACWLIAFTYAWNELFFALVLSDQDAVPMTVVMLGRGGNHHATSALAMLMLAPPAIIALASQRYLVHGLSMGAVRG